MRAGYRLLFLPLAMLAVAATTSGGSISFTASQLHKGATQFSQSCAQCHGDNLEGGAGPALTGPNFKILSRKVGARVGDIFTYMATNMPLNDPASLSHDEYANIMAFILSKNGYKPGNKPLTYSTAMSSKAAIIRQ